ncbi:MAG TPA: gliding motility lipoprotein GldH [Bacteroidales bacterium]|nr:gliding motility lipoprotein GldH [Bacteroidales bacterium]
MAKLIRLLFYLAIAIFAAGCSNRTVFDAVQSTGGHEWHSSNRLRFEAEIDDTVSTYRILLHLRNHVEYPYANLFLFLQTRMPNGHITRDTIECQLADPSGQWYGKGTGPYRQQLIPLHNRLKFPLPGSYVFYIEQAMRDTILFGITDAGLRIERNPL